MTWEENVEKEGQKRIGKEEKKKVIKNKRRMKYKIFVNKEEK